MTIRQILFTFGAALPLLLLATACSSSDDDGDDNDATTDGGGSNATTDGGGSDATTGGGVLIPMAGKGGATAGKGGSTAGKGGSTTDGGGSDNDSGTALTDSGNPGSDGGIISGVGYVPLGAAGNYVILAKSGISTVPASAITGDIAVSPIDATAITGFSLTADSTNTFSISTQVTGKVYAADYAVPTPANLTTAVGDMELAFTDAASRAPDETELGAGNIGGKTLAPGVYKWGTGLLIPNDVTLDGSGTDVWILQIAQDLTVSNGTRIVLTGGAQARNVFWQVAGKVVVGTTAHVEGVVLTQTSITLRTKASIKGRLLAQTAVTIDQSTVVGPP